MDNRQYLREIVENINFEELPPQWNQFDLVKFSHKKKLFEFQQQALKNCLKALYFYFKQKNSNKSELFNHYKLIGLTQDLDFNLSNNKLAILSNYYPSEDSKISFEHFINRMSFWMATGSGKTLVIVKLIEILGKLISSKELPQGNILFLSYREDLIEQFKAHVAEFNSYNFDTKINLIDLKSYDGIMRYSGDLILKKDEINIFYYRSDLISDEQKDKIIDFRNYDNNGKWYIILDEAHKGDREDSKRQMLYSILSRNGFLFNFSATFTDPRDYVTCVFNFNLSEFVKQGYGKHICLSSLDVDAFKDKSDFSTIEKQKIVLKTILLFIYIKKYWEEINSYNQKLYHRPLLVTLVNSVDTEDSDLELFFREVVKIAKNEIKEEFLESVKKELINDILDYEFKFEDLTINIDEAKISSIDYRDILKYFFNAKSSSTIEVLKIPKNKQELIFKLKSTDSPFALIKIGDISNWLKEKLKDYEIIETFDNESYFKRINNDDSLLNLLAGSRAFYEGWDSNRPNILLFLNIGLKDAKIFVLQSIGRGVRIEPKKDLRKRLQNLFNENLIEKELFEKIKDKVLFLETLFVFGTKAKNLEQIINTLNDQVTELNLGKSFIINPKIENKPLLVPVYGESKYLFESFEGNSDTLTLPISSREFELALDFYNFLTQNNDNKIILVKYDIEPVILLKLNEIFEKRNYRFSDSQTISKLAPHLIIRKIVDFLKTKHKDLEKFEKLEKDKFIVHFKNISFRISGLNNYKSIFSELEQKIQTIKNKPSIEKELDQLFKNKKREEYDKKRELLINAQNFEFEGKKIKIKYLLNHYYLPILLPESEKTEYLSHVINVKSEIDFIKELEEYIQKTSSKESFFSSAEWWFFSKIDEHLDDVYIPYYDGEGGKIANFKPDFIFWAKKGKKYVIFFVDPKSTEFTKAFKKIEGYCRIFETQNQGKKQPKIFSFDNLEIVVKLFFWSKNKNILSNYSDYLVSSVEELDKKLASTINQA